jgi:glycerol uptake facilitator-like aquaporin
MAHRLTAEFVGTFWLVLGGCGSAVFAAKFAASDGVSLGIGFLAVNPARSTGVAVFNGDGAPAQLWIFWLAPLIGAAIAGLAYPRLFGASEELADRPVRDDALEDSGTT